MVSACTHHRAPGRQSPRWPRLSIRNPAGRPRAGSQRATTRSTSAPGRPVLEPVDERPRGPRAAPRRRPGRCRRPRSARTRRGRDAPPRGGPRRGSPRPARDRARSHRGARSRPPGAGRSPAVAGSAAPRPARGPADEEHVEHELGADVGVEQLARARQPARGRPRRRPAARSRRSPAAPRAAPTSRIDRSGAELRQREVAGEPAPGIEQHGQRASPLGGRRLALRLGLCVGGAGGLASVAVPVGPGSATAVAAVGASAAVGAPRLPPDPAWLGGALTGCGSAIAARLPARASRLLRATQSDRARRARRGRGAPGRSRPGSPRPRGPRRRRRRGPTRPPASRASRAAVGGSASSRSASRRSMSRTPTGPSRMRAQRDRTVGSSRSSSSAHRISVVPGGRLLERLQQRRLGVVVHPVSVAEDRDPRAALDGQQRELDGEAADGARLGMEAVADADLAAGALGLQAVQVRVVAVLDHPAAAARPARPVAPRSAPVHRSAAARSIASGSLPTDAGPASSMACGTRVASIDADRGDGGRLPDRGVAVHGDRRDRVGCQPSAASAAFGLRGARFFGAARLGVVGRRRRRRRQPRRPSCDGSCRFFGALLGRAAATAASVERRPWPPRRSSGDAWPAAWRPAPPPRRRRAGTASAVRLGRAAAGGAGLRRRRRPRRRPRTVPRPTARAGGRCRRPAAGRPWPIWARSSSSSSGGTSLHGSLLLVPRGARSNRSGRSWRGPRDGCPPPRPPPPRRAAHRRCDAEARRTGSGWRLRRGRRRRIARARWRPHRRCGHRRGHRRERRHHRRRGCPRPGLAGVRRSGTRGSRAPRGPPRRRGAARGRSPPAGATPCRAACPTRTRTASNAARGARPRARRGRRTASAARRNASAARAAPRRRPRARRRPRRPRRPSERRPRRRPPRLAGHGHVRDRRGAGGAGGRRVRPQLLALGALDAFGPVEQSSSSSASSGSSKSGDRIDRGSGGGTGQLLAGQGDQPDGAPLPPPTRRRRRARRGRAGAG